MQIGTKVPNIFCYILEVQNLFCFTVLVKIGIFVTICISRSGLVFTFKTFRNKKDCNS